MYNCFPFSSIPFSQFHTKLLWAVSVRLLVRVHMVGTARVARTLVVKRSRVNGIVLVWVADDYDVAIGSKAIFTVDLFLASAGGGRASPDINVAFP